MNKINLFCLPFAGGSRYSYNNFIRLAPTPIVPVLVDLPGRGQRIREPLLTDIRCMVDDVYRQVSGRLNEPYAIYGHSMGSLLGYLLTKRIIREGLPVPLHLFFTGAAGPSVQRKGPYHHQLPRKDFMEKLREYGGSPEELLNDEHFIDFYEPLLRADFQATETYEYNASVPFDTPISVVIGREEKLSYAEAEAWQQETKQRLSLIHFPGNHFFIFNYEAELLQWIHAKLFSPLQGGLPDWQQRIPS